VPHPIRLATPVPASTPDRVRRSPACRASVHDPRASPPAHRVRVVRVRRTPARRWRIRGRRAQASAIATILGLLLVVTFIASYLSTTLPNQMAVNDLDHELAVQNQVARLAALLSSGAANANPGSLLVQPVSLGSQGAPPFAGADGSTIGPGTTGSALAVSFTTEGPAAYSPPTGEPAGGFNSGTGICPTPTATSFSDTGACEVFWNFTGNSKSFSFSETGSGYASVNVTTSSSTISITPTGSSASHWTVIGNSNTITITGCGSGKTNLSLVGNYDNVSIGTTGSSPIYIYVYGTHDTITVSSVGSGPVQVTVYGTQDDFGVSSDTGSQKFSVLFNGFNATNPTSSRCPYGNLSSSDAVTSFNEVGSGGLTEYVNNAIGYYANSSSSSGCVGNGTCWTTHHQNVALTTCPFFTTISVPFGSSGGLGGAFVVTLRNEYSPREQVAFDEGAVVAAQSGGHPVLVEGPVLNDTGGRLTLFVPEFTGTIGTEAGIGTALLSLRLVSATVLALPANGFSLETGSNVVVTVVTPFAAAWVTYLNATSGLSGLAKSCAPVSVCYGPYTIGGPLGTVRLTIPAKSLSLTIGVFSIGLS
jgi:hypothetical protein